VISGLMYMFYRSPEGESIANTQIVSFETVAVFHTMGAFVLLSFVVVHLYLITTGHTLTSNLKAMITGWEELEDDENTSDKTTEKERENE